MNQGLTAARWVEAGRFTDLSERAHADPGLQRAEGLCASDRVLSSPAVSAAPSCALPFHRLTVAQYHAMRDAHILTADDQVELIDGVLVTKMTKKPPHRLVTRLVRGELERVVPPGYYVDSQEPVTTEDSEPEPDVMVVRGAPRDYADRHPGGRDTPLIIEVADDSLDRDRLKAGMYARAGIAEYWLINLRARTIEVYVQPRDGGYVGRADHTDGNLTVSLDGREVGSIAISAVLP